MGCDYYQSVTLVVKMKDDTILHLGWASEPGYYSFCYDSDEEGSFEREEKEFLSRMDEKLLYEDGSWKISGRKKIRAYEDYIRQHVALNRVQKIRKVKSRRVRI